MELRDELRRRGHIAEFSEDLIDPTCGRTAFAQQLAQAEAYDAIFSIPASFGSIGELHDFARIPGLSHKLLAFVDQDYVDGYSTSTLIQAQVSASCRIELYDRSKLPAAIIDRALDQVYRLQEIFYVQGRR